MTLQVRIATLVLPALPGSDAAVRRANRERTCWQIQDLDGQPLDVGLFVGPELAAWYCKEHGWKPGGFPA